MHVYKNISNECQTYDNYIETQPATTMLTINSETKELPYSLKISRTRNFEVCSFFVLKWNPHNKIFEVTRAHVATQNARVLPNLNIPRMIFSRLRINPQKPQNFYSLKFLGYTVCFLGNPNPGPSSPPRTHPLPLSLVAMISCPKG